MKALVIARKELRDVLREKSLITAFAIQLFLAGFSALLLVGLTALHSPDTIEAAPDATIAYVGDGGFASYLQEARNLDVVELDGADALQQFRAGELLAIVEEQTSEPGAQRSITLILPDGELESTLFITQIKSLLIEYEDDLRTERQDRLEQQVIILDTGISSDRPYAFVYTTLIPLLVVTPVFLSGAIAGDALSQESRSRTLLLLRSTPVSTTQLVAGKLLIPILLVPMQVVVWLFLFWINGFPTASWWQVIAFSTLLGVFLTGSGTLIAALVRDESTTQASYAVLVLGLATFSLLLPRDPMNVIALMASGSMDRLALQTVGILAAASIATVALGIWITSRRIRRDLL